MYISYFSGWRRAECDRCILPGGVGDPSVVSVQANLQGIEREQVLFLVDKPKLTAYSFLFSVDHDLEKTTRQVFSNENAALDWLKNE